MTITRLSRRLRLVIIIAVAALLHAGLAAPTWASVCTLADHIRSANTNTAVGFCPAGTSHDVITIREDITLTEALPPITGTITIEGGGHTISGDGKFRIFDVASGGRLTIKQLTLIEGNGGVLRGGAISLGRDAHLQVEDSIFRNNAAKSGGAIGASGVRNSLTVTNSRFVQNAAEQGGALALALEEALIENSGFSQNLARKEGGAIATWRGDIDISSSTFHSNVATTAGAVFVDGGIVTLTHLTMFNNAATGGTAAGLKKFKGKVYLRNSIIAGSVGTSACFGRLSQNAGNLIEDLSCNPEYGGDPKLGYVDGARPHFVPGDDSPAIGAAYRQFCPQRDQIGTARPFGPACEIGAIESTSAGARGRGPQGGVCTLADRILAANTDQAVGNCPAGTDHDIITISEDITLRLPLPAITGNITIEGGGHTISGDDKFRIFLVNGGNLTVNDLTLQDGYDEDSGGAIAVQNGGWLTVNNSLFIGNRSDLNGGAIDLGGYWWGKSAVERRRGQRYKSPSGRGLRINNSTFYKNRSESWGGALYTAGTVNISNSSFIKNRTHIGGGAVRGSGDRIDITNSTFSENHGGLSGGALRVGDATLTHLTLVDNFSQGYEGSGRSLAIDGNVRLRNSIIAGSAKGELCAEFLAENVGNIIEDGSCATPRSGEAGLGELTGASAHYPLVDGSRAIDSADERFCPPTDQLGNPRPQGGGCDIGAIESTTASPAADSLTADCTLADQITAANLDRAAGSCPAGNGADTISLTRDITLDAALPPITSEFTIEGNGFTISGAGRFRIFDVGGGALTLSNVTLREGKATRGSAIRLMNGARVSASNLGVMHNTAVDGGAIATQRDNAILNLSDSIFVGNSGGALLVDGGTVDIGGSAFVANSVGEGQAGGALDLRKGSVAISNSTFSGNRAGSGGGNCSQSEDSAFTNISLLDEGAQRIAGGIYYHAGSLTLRNSIAATSCDG